jgi:hypothetical protein
LRGRQKQRLKDQAEALLKAFEAIEAPQTFAEADRAAKALLNINKVLEQVHGSEPETPAVERPVLADMSEELKPVMAATYRRLARIDERLGRPSVYAELAAQLSPNRPST